VAMMAWSVIKTPRLRISTDSSSEIERTLFELCVLKSPDTAIQIKAYIV
jgi:hypothetical protein